MQCVPVQNVRDMIRQCLDIQSRIKAAILTFAGTNGRMSTIDERIKKIEYIINQMDELTEHLPEICECGELKDATSKGERVRRMEKLHPPKH